MKIETITANSNNKTEAYRLLVMLHQMALSQGNGWSIRATATYPDYVLTSVTNDIVDIIAITEGNFHTYTMKQCEADDE